ncbi:MAG: uroporphyrinogen decarboxylase family protein [Candidatus Heteroscillospira sp.]
MLPRERMLAHLNHEEPDQICMGENIMHCSMIEQYLGREVLFQNGFKELKALWEGRRDEVIQDGIDVMSTLPQTLGWDYIRVPVCPRKKEYVHPVMTGPNSWIDPETGTEMRYNYATAGQIAPKYNTEMTIDDLPDPDEEFVVDPSELEVAKGVVERIKKTHFVIARPPLDGSFAFKQTVGIQEFLMRMITDPEFIHRARQVYVKRSIAYIKAFLEIGVDAIMTTDDYADNRGLMMGYDRFKEFILPGIEQQIAATHEAGGYFIKHTDGKAWDALPDLVALGIDGWHGIQPSIGMDMKLVKERFGKDICLFGGVNCETLITGTPEDVEREAMYAIQHAAPGGGYVLTSGNCIEPGVPKANYDKMLEVREKYGKYPISL